MSNNLAFLYGLLQGLTEFLPVSSSGHLALIPSVFAIKDPGVAFDLLMHLGTAMAVLLYYHKQWWLFLRNLFFPTKWDQKFKILLIASTVTFTLALGLKKLGSTWGRSPDIIAFNLIFFGLLMWLVDRKQKEEKLKESKKVAFFLGLSQALAIFPGVSRSGITITMARLLKVNRKEAGDISFMLSLPIILGGVLFLFLKGEMNFTEITTVQMLIGICTSFLSGILAIKFFLMILERFSLFGFFLYRLLLGLSILFLY